MRFIKLSSVVVLALTLLASAALAGDACHKDAAAAGTAAACPAKASTSASCGHQMAGASCPPGCCTVETMRLPSGGLVVHYIATSPEAVAKMQARAESSPETFCCHLKKASTDEACKVDISKVSNGVLVYVSSPKKEVLDAYEKEFAQMTAKK